MGYFIGSLLLYSLISAVLMFTGNKLKNHVSKTKINKYKNV